MKQQLNSSSITFYICFEVNEHSSMFFLPFFTCRKKQLLLLPVLLPGLKNGIYSYGENCSYVSVYVPQAADYDRICKACSMVLLTVQLMNVEP